MIFNRYDRLNQVIKPKVVGPLFVLCIRTKAQFTFSGSDLVPLWFPRPSRAKRGEARPEGAHNLWLMHKLHTYLARIFERRYNLWLLTYKVIDCAAQRRVTFISHVCGILHTRYDMRGVAR